MKDEKYIRTKMSSPNPFRVPDGYFEGFASEFMQALPDERPSDVVLLESRPRLRKLWGMISAAACFCLLVFGAVFYFSRNSSISASQADSDGVAYSSSVATELYDEAVADYTMIDNADIYAYLVDDFSE